LLWVYIFLQECLLYMGWSMCGIIIQILLSLHVFRHYFG